MGNPFKQVKTAIKDAYHSNTSSASTPTKPLTEKPTIVKTQHAVPPPHDMVAAQANLSLSGKRVSQLPPVLPPRQADSCQNAQSTPLVAGEQPKIPESEQLTMSANILGPELPSREAFKDTSHGSFDNRTGEERDPAHGADLDIPPPVPKKMPLELTEKHEEEKKVIAPSDEGKIAGNVESTEQSQITEAHPTPVSNKTPAADETPSMPTVMHLEDDAVKKNAHSTEVSAMGIPVTKSSTTADDQVSVGSSPATNLPAQGKDTRASADGAGRTGMTSTEPAVNPSIRAPHASAEGSFPKNQNEREGGSASTDVPTATSVGQCIAATATGTTSAKADSSSSDLDERSFEDCCASGVSRTTNAPVTSNNTVDTLSSDHDAAKQSATASSPVPAAQPTDGLSGNDTALSNDNQPKECAAEGSQPGNGQEGDAQGNSKTIPPSGELNPSAIGQKPIPTDRGKASETNAATTEANGTTHGVAKATEKPGLKNHSDSGLSPGQLNMPQGTDAETDSTDRSSSKSSEVSSAPISSLTSQDPTVQPKSFGLFAKSMLNHLQRVYDGLLPDSAKKDRTGATASEHDQQQSSEYFIKFVQKESEPRLSGLKFRGFTEFLEYMTTSANAASSPKQQDLTLSLPNYYCNSSHNTYLTGNQLYSECSSDVYRTVLERGCRCLEIDVWDGEDGSEETSRRSSTSSSSSDDAHTTSSVSKKLHGVYTAESQITSGLKREMKLEAKGVMSSISGGFHKISSKAKKMMPEATAEGESSFNGPIDTSAAVNYQQQPSLPETGPRPVRIEPRVLHGHTLTREVPFREVCEVIRDSAFVSSDLPVIVSLEVHAGHEQQKIMVEIMTEVWKELLVTVSQEIREKLAKGETTTLPSPADLRHKILIKVKSSPREDSSMTPKASSSGAEGEVLELQPSLTTSSESIGTPIESERSNKAAPKTKLIDELSALGIYTSAYSFKGLDQPEAKLPNHIFSFSESKLLEYFNKDRKALFEHNRNFMMRTYPSQFRIRSSNPDPSFSWRQGVQFAALNWQSIDLGMMINHAMFDGTGGWVLKPQTYRSDSWRRGLKAQETDPKRALNLIIDVYAGQDIPLPSRDTNPKKFHPYVSCQLHVERPKDSAQAGSQESGSDDEDSETWKRKTNGSTGIHPDFDGQRLQFPRCPNVIEDLTFVRFKVKERELMRATLSSWACIRLDRLQPGFRLVHLLDAKGRNTDGVLLVGISKQFS